MAVQEPGFLMFKDVVWDDHDDLEELGPVAEIAAPEADPES